MKTFYNILWKNAFVRGSAVLFVGMMIGNALNYVFHVVVGRMVSVEVYGEVESLIALMTIITVPAATLTMIATKYSAECKADNNFGRNKQLIRYLYGKTFWYGIPVFLVSLILAPWIRDFLKLESVFGVIMVFGAMLVSFLAAINTGALTGWQKFASVSIAGISGGVAKLILSIVLVVVGFGLNGVMGGIMLSGVFGYVVSMLFLRFILKRRIGNKNTSSIIEKNEMSSMVRYGLPVLFGVLALSILGHIDMMFAKNALSSFESGQYGALFIVAKVIFFAVSILATVLFAVTSEREHKKEDSRYVFFLAMGFTVFGAAVATTCYFLIPEFVISLFFGDRYAGAAEYLGWFAVVASLYSVTYLILQYLLSLRATRAVVWYVGIAILEIASLFLAAESISSILIIVSVAQILSLLVGGVFVWKHFSQLKQRHV